MLHFRLHKTRPSRIDYDPVPGDDDESLPPHKGCFPIGGSRRRSLVAIVAVVLIVWCCALAFELVMPHSKEAVAVVSTIHHERIPTLLSLVDPLTSQYLYALDNPLYDEIQQSKLNGRSNGGLDLTHVKEFPEISVNVEREVDRDRRSRTERSSLTVSWTAGKDWRGAEILMDHDLLVLQCGDSRDELQILEVATLAQVRATHALGRNSKSWYNNFDSVDRFQSRVGDEWYIANIPSSILRHRFCQFVLYQKSREYEYDAVAESTHIQLGEVNKPAGIHLALSAHVDRMLVQFVTGAMGTPIAQYGTEMTKLTYKSTGTSDTYTADSMCQAPANETAPGKFQSPGYLHAVTLSDLLPDTVYYYKVGLETGQGVTWSSTFHFRTSLPIGDATQHSYLVYGDQGCPAMGWGDGSAWVAAMTARESNTIRSIHHVGDLSYAQGAAHQWDAWLDMIEPIAAQVPLMIAVGNHEYDHEAGGGAKDPSFVETQSGFMPVWGDFGNDSGGECGVPISKRFTMPATGNGVFWYSFDYGLVHTVVISSEHDLSIGSPQHTWLEQDLLNMNRTLTPWLIVESHRPFYEGERIWNENSVGVAMRLEVEDLFHDFQVDLVIAGHYHAYHRTCDGLYRSKCENGGPMHLTIGTAGAHLEEADIGMFTNTWTAKAILQTYGYGRLTVYSETTLGFQFVKAGNESDPTAGTVLDDFWIVRER